MRPKQIALIVLPLVAVAAVLGVFLTRSRPKPGPSAESAGRPGTLAAGFGDGGWAKPVVRSGSVVARAAAMQGERLVVAAEESDAEAGKSLLLLRFDPSGKPDEGFSARTREQRAPASVSGDHSEAPAALAVQRDGSLVVAGSAKDGHGTPGFLLSRFRADGAPLIRRTTPFAGARSARAASVVLDPADRIVLAGTIDTSAGTALALVRYTADGVEDAAFGPGGRSVLRLPLEGGTDLSLGAAAFDGDGRLWLTGGITRGKRRVAYLVRFRSDGGLDTTLGGHGVAVTSFGTAAGNAEGTHLVLVRGGALIGGSALEGGHTRVAFARFNERGEPDPAFGSQGVRITDHAGDSRLRFLGVDGARRLVAGGDATAARGFAVLAVRYLTNGSLDGSFGTTEPEGLGRFVAAREASVQVHGGALTPAGRLYLVGAAEPAGKPTELAVAAIE